MKFGPYVEQRPILGYGYGGFWTPSHISEISEGEKWGIPNSHSAYLDNLLMLGVVGLIVLCPCILRAESGAHFVCNSLLPGLRIRVFWGVLGFLRIGWIS